MPPTPTRRAPSVLGVCGWVSAPRTALPRVGNALGSFTWGRCSAASGCAAHYHTFEQPHESLSTRPTCAPRGRGPTTRPLPSTHGPDASTPSDSALAQAIPAPLHAPSRRDVPPHPTTQAPCAPVHDDAREVHAGRSWGGRTVRGSCPRCCGHRLGAVFASSQSGAKVPGVNPLSKIPTARARPGFRPLALVVPSERPWATRRPRSGGLRAPWTVERRAGCSSAPTGS